MLFSCSNRNTKTGVKWNEWKGNQIAEKQYFWVYLWQRFWMRLVFESVQWVRKMSDVGVATQLRALTERNSRRKWMSSFLSLLDLGSLLLSLDIVTPSSLCTLRLIQVFTCLPMSDSQALCFGFQIESKCHQIPCMGSLSISLSQGIRFPGSLGCWPL